MNLQACGPALKRDLNECARCRSAEALLPPAEAGGFHPSQSHAKRELPICPPEGLLLAEGSPG